ncbi:hypothetical protein [Prosthecobacter sp.]|uniref:hypothetical protein n=1 Tax=Prosthecobacter sp. TaxID=1965333 RepID=UPI001DD1F08A|nr:hypothetical protein [Prosthecobacter sp.]MCB1275877.1 hypothetical protein [Prosthecobacter sp.]
MKALSDFILTCLRIVTSCPPANLLALGAMVTMPVLAVTAPAAAGSLSAVAAVAKWISLKRNENKPAGGE